MKNVKKLSALLLALVMAFAMSATALAVSNGTATIDVYVDGEYYFSLDASVGTNTTVKDALDQNVDMLATEWDTVTNYNPNFGATGQVARTIMGAGTDPVGADSGITAQFWSSAYPGYGIEYTSLDNEGNTVYHFIYAGYDWVYEVNGETPVDESNGYQLYMDQCYLDDGDVITLSYDLQVSRWEDTYNWMTE